ncbi:hypothetical protein [Actinomadura madurae]|nr:hypothetical protein [Actinomadura madurae]MCP9951511.1 hypothetical protein [Actinomadura madurae]MCQ0016945.1 hypothetical protein [Actinomadura madurae]
MPPRDADRKPEAGGRAAFARRLRGRLAALARRAGPSAALVLAGGLGGLGYALFTPSTYTATSFVMVVDERDGGAGPAAVSFAQAFGRLAPLPETLQYSSIPLPKGAAGATREHIQASTSPDTPLIRLAAAPGRPATPPRTPTPPPTPSSGTARPTTPRPASASR